MQRAVIGFEKDAEKTRLLSAVVQAAGGRVEIPKSALIAFPIDCSLRIFHDNESDTLILEVKKNGTDNR